MEQTITQWFNLLMEPYKTQALANILSGRQERMCESMSDAIDKGMNWSDTPQGHEHWAEIRRYFLDYERDGIDITDALAAQAKLQAEREARSVTYSTSMRDMLNKLSDDCKVSKILRNVDWVTNSFCNYVTTRNGMLSFLPSGREHKVNPENGRWLRDGRQEMKPAKLARKLMIDRIVSECDDKDFETFGNKVRAYLGVVGDEDGEGRNINIEVIQGDAIRHAYNGANYSRVLGGGTNLHGSCMRGTNMDDWFYIYEKNDDKVQLLVAKDTQGMILGRALLWSFDDGDKGMDTVYGADIITELFKDWAVDNGYWYKSNQSCHHHEFNMFNGEFFDNNQLDGNGKLVRCATIMHHDFDNYPYLDTMFYLMKKDGVYMLANRDKSAFGSVEKTLRNTDGNYQEYDDDEYDEDYVILENGDSCHVDSAIYLDYRNYCGDVVSGYYHECVVVYAEDGNHYRREDCARIDCNWYTKDDDAIVWLDGRDAYYLEEDTVYCEQTEMQIHVDDAVELHDGTYCDIDYAHKCQFDDLFYKEDDMVKTVDGLWIAKDNEATYIQLQEKIKQDEQEREGTIA